MAAMNERFEMRVDEEILARVDAWRARQSDLPSRAQAMRRLVEVGLASNASEGVSLSDGEKLLLLMMRDLYEHLKITNGDGIDPQFISDVIHGGHYWAAKWGLPGVFHNHQDDPRDLRFVLDVLGMWDQLERGYERLSKSDKARVAKEAAPLGKNVKFLGFDGNNETAQLGIALFLVNKMDRFSRFKDRDLNAHMPTFGMHQRMLTVFEKMERDILGTDLGADQIIALLQAQVHPERRATAQRHLAAE